MRIKNWILRCLICLLITPVIVFGQTTASKSPPGKSTEEMKAFFFKMDDAFNIAMAKKDSLYFVNSFADSFINCTPLGEINSKSEEIATLLSLPFTHVERTALKYDIFTYSDKVATMSVTKKITRKDATIIYVRRSIVYNFIDGKWLIASGQGTNVPAKEID